MGPFPSRQDCWRKKHAGLTKPSLIAQSPACDGPQAPKPQGLQRVLHRAHAQLAHAEPTLAGATSLGRLGSMDVSMYRYSKASLTGRAIRGLDEVEQ